MFAFDCLSLNGRTLLQEPLTARREALYSALNESEGHLQFATAKVRVRFRVLCFISFTVCLCLWLCEWQGQLLLPLPHCCSSQCLSFLSLCPDVS